MDFAKRKLKGRPAVLHRAALDPLGTVTVGNSVLQGLDQRTNVSSSRGTMPPPSQGAEEALLLEFANRMLRVKANKRKAGYYDECLIRDPHNEEWIRSQPQPLLNSSTNLVVKVTSAGIPLKMYDIVPLLNTGQSINDEIVNAFIRIAKTWNPKGLTAHIVNTFFYSTATTVTVQGGPRVPDFANIKQHLFGRTKEPNGDASDFVKCEQVLIPIHYPGHWFVNNLLLKRKTVEVYCSMHWDSKYYGQYVQNLQELCVHWVRVYTKEETNPRDWTVVYATCPKQLRYSNDCAIHVLLNIVSLISGAPLVTISNEEQSTLCRGLIFRSIMSESVRELLGYMK
jgi:Ulp1 family protease